MRAMLGAAAAVALAACGTGVDYAVTGTACAVDVTWANADGGVTQVSNVPLPWRHGLTAGSGDFVYVSAQNRCASGSVTATIWREDFDRVPLAEQLLGGRERFKTATSSGAYVIATASGSL